MKILFYLGHPAHFHLFKNVIKILKKNKNEIFILIKKKDVLEYLIKKSGLDYTNIQPGGRKDSKFGIAVGLIKRDFQILKFCIKNKPNIMVGTSTELTHVGKILNIASINVNEDDHDAVPLFSKLGYPWANHILAPEICNTGKWKKKTINYKGFHELAYLHPKYFNPNIEAIKNYIDTSKPFFIIRFAKLNAHHDNGKTGITNEIAKNIINLLKPHGNIYITSERKLDSEFEPYRIKIDPFDIHHALFFSQLYIGDSQTMAAESAVLGTPSIRFNDFVGKLGYLEELEHKYGLTYGIETSCHMKLYSKINELVNLPNLKEIYAHRKNEMLKECIDVSSFFAWFIEGYPESTHTIIKKNE